MAREKKRAVQRVTAASALRIDKRGAELGLRTQAPGAYGVPTRFVCLHHRPDAFRCQENKCRLGARRGQFPAPGCLCGDGTVTFPPSRMWPGEHALSALRKASSALPERASAERNVLRLSSA